MRVLWFAVTPSMYEAKRIGHNGGGWISSLEVLVQQIPNIDLGIAFEHTDTCFKAVRENKTYYPINIWRSRWDRIKSKFIYNTEEKLLIQQCLKVIDDFKPDVIHVFGTEWSFGLLPQHTKVPVVIHIQGSIPPYYNARFPAGYSAADFVLTGGINIAKTLRLYFADRQFKLRAAREEKILRNCQYYMGRTHWDKNLTRLYAPHSKYFYCSEALRSVFVQSAKRWEHKTGEKHLFVTTISAPLYKGGDVVLKTALLLKQNTTLNFEWRVFGINEMSIHETKTKIKHTDVNVILGGIISAEDLRDELLTADIFIHPSYIDNSPNSVCEAQVLGMPVICTNVGGTATIVEDGQTGLLVPSNDPFTMAADIIKLLSNPALAIQLGSKAKDVALVRHGPQNIITDLTTVYNSIAAK